MDNPAKDTLTGAVIDDGRYKAHIVYFDEKEEAYREATFSSFVNLMIWIGRIREGEGSGEGEM